MVFDHGAGDVSARRKPELHVQHENGDTAMGVLLTALGKIKRT